MPHWFAVFSSVLCTFSKLDLFHLGPAALLPPTVRNAKLAVAVLFYINIVCFVAAVPDAFMYCGIADSCYPA